MVFLGQGTTDCLGGDQGCQLGGLGPEIFDGLVLGEFDFAAQAFLVGLDFRCRLGEFLRRQLIPFSTSFLHEARDFLMRFGEAISSRVFLASSSELRMVSSRFCSPSRTRGQTLK